LQGTYKCFCKTSSNFLNIFTSERMGILSIKNYLSREERDKILQTLTNEQQEFLTAFLKRGKKTAFANIMAKEKAGDSVDGTDIASLWEFIDYNDAGPDWNSTSTLYCECGRKLRYQYVVRNLETNEIKKFGIAHFEEHTGIPANLANKIKAGLESIDYELDEILLKVSHNWSLSDEGIDVIPADIELSKDIRDHLNVDLPLLDRQVRRIKDAIRDIETAKKMESLLSEVAQLATKPNKRKSIEKEEAIKHPSTLSNEKINLMNSSYWKEIQGCTDLKENLQLGVILFLNKYKNKEVLASDITESLVKYHGADRDRFSTGKYKIYPYVCMFLEHLVDLDKLLFVKKIGQRDRVYITNKSEWSIDV